MATAALVGYATLRTVRPLVSPDEERTAMVGERTRVALEREKLLTLRSIKELEFDRAMGRLSDEDFKEMSGRLRARAARLIRQLDAGGGYRDQIERDLARSRGRRNALTSNTPRRSRRSARLSRACCAAARTANDADARFCKGAGRSCERAQETLKDTEDTENGRRHSETNLRVARPLCPWCPLRRALRSAQFQMPDPKEMSGIPRPVDDLPDGAISVRLIRGALSNNIAGQPVELRVGGKEMTVKTDEAGARSSTRCRPAPT